MSHGSALLGVESPCDSCQLKSICSHEQLACRAYTLYCQGKRWGSASRVPTHTIFKRIYTPPSRKDYEKLERQLQKIRAKRALEETPAQSVHCEA
jgi:hypothetical protein